MHEFLAEMGDDARDFFELGNALFPFARQMLEKQGHFAPVGAQMAPDGKVSLVASGDGGSVEEQMTLFRLIYRKLAGEGQVRAVATCFDTRAHRPESDVSIDAVCMRVEHARGVAAEFFVSYKKGWLGWKFGEVFAVEIEPDAFAAPVEEG